MIRGRLRSRRQADALPNQPRFQERRFGRIIYLAIVAVFFIYLARIFIGPFVTLQANGIVTTMRYTVAAAYTAQVDQVFVQGSQEVKRGDILVTLDSPEVLASIAKLTSDQASMRSRREQVEGRIRGVEALFPIAEARLAQSQNAAAEVTRVADRGLTSSTFQTGVMRDFYDAQREVASLQAESGSLKSELAGIEASLKEVDAALAQTKRAYGGGVMKANVEGIVSAQVPNPGAVFSAGTPLMEILIGTPYVLAYLPAGRLYTVAKGDPVVITDGTLSAKGRVERIEDMSDYLPPEFQTAFKPNEKQQIVRVIFEQESPFPIFSKISITSPWGLTHLAALFKTGVAHLNDPHEEPSPY